MEELYFQNQGLGIACLILCAVEAKRDLLEQDKSDIEHYRRKRTMKICIIISL